jgi:hypothetical protein
MTIVCLVASVSSFGYRAAAAEANKSEIPKECAAPSVKAFDKAVNEVLKQTELPEKDPDTLWSKNPTFLKWVNSPKSTLTDVEKHLRCYPSQALEEVRMLSAALACADVDSHLAYIQRLTQAHTSKVNGWALHYAVAPGDRWSTKLSLSYSRADVRSTLEGVAHSSNVTPGLQRIILEILNGTANSALAANPVKPLVTCSDRPGK